MPNLHEIENNLDAYAEKYKELYPKYVSSVEEIKGSGEREYMNVGNAHESLYGVNDSDIFGIFDDLKKIGYDSFDDSKLVSDNKIVSDYVDAGNILDAVLKSITPLPDELQIVADAYRRAESADLLKKKISTMAPEAKQQVALNELFQKGTTVLDTSIPNYWKDNKQSIAAETQSKIEAANAPLKAAQEGFSKAQTARETGMQDYISQAKLARAAGTFKYINPKNIKKPIGTGFGLPEDFDTVTSLVGDGGKDYASTTEVKTPANVINPSFQSVANELLKYYNLGDKNTFKDAEANYKIRDLLNRNGIDRTEENWNKIINLSL